MADTQNKRLQPRDGSKQPDPMQHGQGTGPIQGEAPRERSGPRKARETRTGLAAECSVRACSVVRPSTAATASAEFLIAHRTLATVRTRERKGTDMF